MLFFQFFCHKGKVDMKKLIEKIFNIGALSPSPSLLRHGHHPFHGFNW